MKKTWHSLKNRVTAMLLALICVLGLLPTAARDFDMHNGSS